MNFSKLKNKVGSNYRIALDEGDLILVLNEVTELPPHFPPDYKGPKPDNMPETRFRLTLQGPPHPVLNTITHKLIDENGEELFLFLSPFMKNSDGVFYDCIIG